MERITILIADDHTIVRHGLRAMLETDPRMEIIGEAHDGAEAVEKAIELNPKVILMDISMPCLNGIEATRQIKDICPTTVVIIMTSFEDEALIVNAVQAGAAGYLLKDTPRELLINTITTAVSGGTSISYELLRRALEGVEPAFLPDDAPVYQQKKDYEELTPRELEILKLISEGWTNKEIAEHKSFAADTVKKEVHSIITKLRASDRTHAAIKAVRLGLLT
jgi:DNA-binding NarL/FixJ family response regulator